VIRCDGDDGTKWLFKNNFIDNIGPTGQTSLRISGSSEWILVQDNVFGEKFSLQDSGEGESRVRRYIIAERNLVNRNLEDIHSVGIGIAGQNHVFRNNVVYHDSGSANSDYAVGSVGSGPPSNVWLINNTSINNDTQGISVSSCSDCVTVNNLVYTTNTTWGSGCMSGTGTFIDNWCYNTGGGTCRDPVDGDTDCFNPNFESLTIGNPNFARPGPGSRGVDNGSNAAPVWQDFYFDERDDGNIDVGAVERP
jgi:hypothetical protein